ncbi:hypothetical protein CHS0354_003400 [Potamilus streckersoni]|uniref:Uncharacterized protein n=1 Tax=Potamilus streckersoni TaxID=2493646 RepID=A0AAE0VZ12_9BIVA|nr:hypothetical protein CHS0354_003400 [Potamilus streckersoni]
MNLSTLIRIALVCEMVAGRFIGILNNDTLRSWGLWYNQKQPDQRTQVLPHPPRYVPFPQVSPEFLNNQGKYTENRRASHLQQTILLANNLHIQSPSALNNTGRGKEHVHLQNKVDSARNRSWTQTNTPHELNAFLQNRSPNQSFHIENRPSAGVDKKWTADNVAKQTPGLSQRLRNKILISFNGASNNDPSHINKRQQTSVDSGSSSGRIFVKSKGTVNISHPRGMIEISRSHNGRSNIIIKTNANDTNGTPQNELPTEVINITQTTYISDVSAMVTTKYESTTEEMEHEAP